MLEENVLGAYSYLGDHHKDWLLSRMIYERERKHHRDYEEQLINKVRDFIDQLAAEGYPKRQVTFGYIASIIGSTRDALRCRKSTHALLEKVAESREAWLRRQVITAYNQRPPSVAPFSLADAKHYLTIHNDTFSKRQTLIEQIINELNNRLFHDKE